MGKAYRFTSARRNAFRKAQLISARKRKGRGRLSRKTQQRVGIVSAAALVGGAAYARHKLSGSSVHGPVGVSNTPMAKAFRGNKVVSVAATKAGLRVSNYNSRDGFSMTLTARGFGKDALLGGYRHKPLTMAGLKSIVGKKLRGGSPANVTGWSPAMAHRKSPKKVDMELVRSFGNRRALTHEESARRRLARRNSIGGGIARKRTISRIEAYRRERAYIAQMELRGTPVNAAHKLAVGRAFLREFK